MHDSSFFNLSERRHSPVANVVCGQLTRETLSAANGDAAATAKGIDAVSDWAAIAAIAACDAEFTAAIAGRAGEEATVVSDVAVTVTEVVGEGIGYKILNVVTDLS